MEDKKPIAVNLHTTACRTLFKPYGLRMTPKILWLETYQSSSLISSSVWYLICRKRLTKR